MLVGVFQRGLTPVDRPAMHVYREDHPVGWRDLNRKNMCVGGEAPASFSLCCLPDDGQSENSCLSPAALPSCQDGLCLQTRAETKPPF